MQAPQRSPTGSSSGAPASGFLRSLYSPQQGAQQQQQQQQYHDNGFSDAVMTDDIDPEAGSSSVVKLYAYPPFVQTPSLSDLHMQLVTRRRVHITWYGSNPFATSVPFVPSDFQQHHQQQQQRRRRQGGSPPSLMRRSGSIPLSGSVDSHPAASALVAHHHSHSPPAAALVRSGGRTPVRSASAVDLYCPVAEQVPGDPVPDIDEERLVGLGDVKNALNTMVTNYMDPVMRNFYSDKLRPDRLLYVRSSNSSGIRTLVSIVCKKSKVTLLRIDQPSSDLEWSQDFFAQLLDFAILVQPALILLDRCDFWFLRTEQVDAYADRGRAFEYAYKAHPSLMQGTEDVWVVFSCMWPLADMAADLRMIVHLEREVIVPDFSDEDRAEVIKGLLLSHLQDLETRILAFYPGLAEKTRTYFSGVKKAWADHIPNLVRILSAYTPGMVDAFVSRLFVEAQKRELSATQHAVRAANMYKLVPETADLSVITGLAHVASPGVLTWRPAPPPAPPPPQPEPQAGQFYT